MTPQPLPQEALIQVDRCLICGASELEPELEHLLDVEDGTPGEYEISRCRACDFRLLSRRPKPASMNEFYLDQYHVLTREKSFQITTFLYSISFGMRVRTLLKALPKRPESILELGCGDPAFLLKVESKIPTARRIVGVDINFGSGALPPGSKVQLIKSEIEQLQVAEKFDTILMYEVLEHVSAPEKTLQAVKDLLNPGGTLVITVPNWKSLWRKLFPRHWAGLQVPRHLSFFEPKTLKLLLNRQGFEVISHKGLFVPGDLGVSICIWLKDRLGLRRPARKITLFPLIILLSVPFVWLGSLLFKNRSHLFMVAKKL